MRGIRVRWASAAKAAAVAAVAVVALQALPSLLKPPDPPPLAPDVGLPQVVPAERAPEAAAPKLSFQKHRMRAKGTRRPRREDDPAKARFQTHEIGAKGTTELPPAPEPPTYVPPPAPAPEPAAAPVAPTAVPSPPPPVGDGSEEFAPR